MPSAVQTGIGPLVVAVGHPGALLRWSLSNAVLLGAVAYLAAPLGLVALAVAITAFRLLRFLMGHHLLLGRIVGIPLRGRLAAIRKGPGARTAPTEEDVRSEVSAAEQDSR